jgi:hypothetical protein
MTGSRTKVAAALLICVMGCGDEGSYSSSPHATVAAFEVAGLEASKFTDAKKAQIEKLGAKSCTAGKVSGIHVTLCRYDSDEAAKAARDKGVAAIGKATGLSLARGSLLMIAADRDKVDPSGRNLNRIGKAFWGKS